MSGIILYRVDAQYSFASLYFSLLQKGNLAMNDLTTREKLAHTFSALSVQTLLSLVLGILLFSVPQLRDLIMQTERGGWELLVPYTLSVAYFCFVTWWTSRFILDFSYKKIAIDSAKPEQYPSGPYKWIPRLLPGLMLSIVAISAFVNGACKIAIISISIGTVMFYIFLNRRVWTETWRANPSALTSLLIKPQSWWASLAIMLIVPTFFALFALQKFADVVAGLALILLGLANMILGLTLVTYFIVIPTVNILTSRLSKMLYKLLPHVFKEDNFLVMMPPHSIVSTALVLAIVISIIFETDNHAFRTLPEVTKPYKNLDGAYADFTARLNETQPLFSGNITIKGESDKRRVVPIFIVANQGGGLRAAYWSGVALSKLEQRFPGFHRHVFAMSGASGGTMGNATYIAAVSANPGNTLSEVMAKANNVKNCGTEQEKSTLSCRVKFFLSRDFLSPTVASLLHNDALYRFLPFSFADGDRAFQLEMQFVDAYDDAFAIRDGHGSMLNSGYLNFYINNKEHKVWRPILIGTSYIQELGAMSLTVPFEFTSEFGLMYDLQGLQRDQQSESKAKLLQSNNKYLDIPFITVAVNSARFPYVTPTGSLSADKHYDEKLHTADAGYFDNYGAKAAGKIIAAITNIEKNKLNSTKQSEPIYFPVLLVIKNAPSYVLLKSKIHGEHLSQSQETVEELFDPTVVPACSTSWPLNSITAPIQGFLASRGGHTELNLSELESLISRTSIETVEEFSLLKTRTILLELEQGHRDICKKSKDAPPVGWWLSNESQRTLDSKSDALLEQFEQDICTFNKKVIGCN